MFDVWRSKDAFASSCASFPFNGHLTVSVDFACFRVFCQAVQPLETCEIACGWYPDTETGRFKYIEPHAPTKDALKLIQDTLRLKRTQRKRRKYPKVCLQIRY